MIEKINEVSCEVKENPIEIGLLVTGSAVDKNIIITKHELSEIGKGKNSEYPFRGPRYFSTYDKHGENTSKSIRIGEGIDLNCILDKAGVKNAEEIKFKSTDNFETTITEYSSEKHYYYPNIKDGNSQGAQEVSAMLAFNSNESEVKYFPHPNLMLGQKGLEDKNKDFFAKGIKAITVGNKQNVFYIDGAGVKRKRNFTLLQLLELLDSQEVNKNKVTYPLKTQEATFTYKNHESDEKHILSCRGISLAILLNYMGIKKDDPQTDNLKVTFNHHDYFQNSSIDIFVKDIFESSNNYFLSIQQKESKDSQINIYCKDFILKNIKGISIGKQSKKAVVTDIGKKPNKYDNNSEFFIYITNSGGNGNFYYYTIDELLMKYGENSKAMSQEFSFYNHNMNNGKGANRKVLAKGFYLKSILEDISELGGMDNIINETMTMQLCALDGYRAENQVDVTEVYDYNYFLAYEIDQRTESGLEPNDTSIWGNTNYSFIPAEDETRFVIYCNKGSANPSVYTKIIGIAINTEGGKIAMGANGENCSYTVLYENNHGKELKSPKVVCSCIQGMQVTEKAPTINNCKAIGEIKKTITLCKGENNKIIFNYEEDHYFYIKYFIEDKSSTNYIKLTDLKEKEPIEFETEEYVDGLWTWRSRFTKVKLSNILNINKEKNITCQLVKSDGGTIYIDNIDETFIVYKELKKKAAGKLIYNIDYACPAIICSNMKLPKDMYKDIVGIIIK